MLNISLLRHKTPTATAADPNAWLLSSQCLQPVITPHRPQSHNWARRSLLGCSGLGLAVYYLKSPALGWSSELRQWPVELQVGRFQIHADFDVSNLTDLPLALSDLAEDVTSVLDVAPSQQPVHVVLFASASEYQRYMRNYFPQLPERRALFIQDRGPGMLFAHWHADIASDLRHEVAHALLNDAPRPLPLWLDEGLAKYFEAERSRRFDGHVYLQEVCQRARNAIVPALETLEAVNQLSDFHESHYRDSWAWGHFLIHRSVATRNLLKHTLAEHRSGADTLPFSRQLALLSSRGGSDAQSEFLAHFRMFA